MFSNLVDNDTLALIIQTFNIAKKNNIFDNLNISEDDKKIIEVKIKKSANCYKFISKPFESKKSDPKLLKEIERAIDGNRFIELIHKEREETKKYKVKPYKILFMQENFYLACENCNESYPFTLFRIINIQSIELQSNTFHKNYNIVDFIEHIQTPRPKYSEDFKNNLVEVVLEVEKTRAKHFKAKKHMPSQKEIETKDDGTLVLSFKVTQELEMEDLIKKWIPFMRVIKPLSLKEKIDNDLKRYLNKNEATNI
jgi:predicted DNA-binding transcriptional regulator YafY